MFARLISEWRGMDETVSSSKKQKRLSAMMADPRTPEHANATRVDSAKIPGKKSKMDPDTTARIRTDRIKVLSRLDREDPIEGPDTRPARLP